MLPETFRQSALALWEEKKEVFDWQQRCQDAASVRTFRRRVLEIWEADEELYNIADKRLAASSSSEDYSRFDAAFNLRHDKALAVPAFLNALFPDSLPPLGEGRLRSAFGGDYIDPEDRCMRYILGSIEKRMREFVTMFGEFYAPFISIVQSSGSGKSRAVKRISEMGVVVFYFSLLDTSSQGYPRGYSPLISKIKGISHEDDVYALFSACFRVFRQHDEFPVLPQFFQDQEEGRVSAKVDLEWNQRPKCSLVEMHEEFSSLLLKLEQKFGEQGQQLRGRCLQFLFVVDEARRLLESPDPRRNSPFTILRRACAGLPIMKDPVGGCFCLVVDTSAKVSNRAPMARKDSSDKVFTGQSKLFPPLYLLPTIDLRGNQTATLEDAAKPETLFSLGRPLWYRCLTELRMPAKALVKFAKQKLLGARMEDLKTQTMAAAILGFRIGIEIYPQSEMAQDLVASHMRVCVHISDDREGVLSMVLPEPVLAEAAAQIMHEEGLFERHVHQLVSMLQAGLVRKCERGELVTRLLLLQAMDRCLLRTPSDDCRFSQPIYLEDFLKSLFGEEQWKGFGNGLQHLKKAKVFFNAFYPIWKKNPSIKDLIGFIRHNGSATCKQGQPGFDLLMPYMLPDEQGSYRLEESLSGAVGFQIKNHEKRPNSKKVLKHMLASSMSMLNKGAAYPSIHILVQFGEGDKFFEYCDDPARVTFVAEGLDCFPGLDQDKNVKTAVELLLQERTDPTIFFEDESIERECLQNIFSLSYGSVPDPIPKKQSRKRTAGGGLWESVA